MKFVALVSGGKDSIYNLCKCIDHGHQLVAAANLVPPNAVEEIDSFMYQSAGHVVIESIAKCLDVPLVRREIRGTAVQQGLHYTPTTEDEVEDLFLLLQDVKTQFPEVQGVAVGAILSNYQRDRVENVCSRLDLTCLAFLWQKKQKQLLSEMIEYGIEAVLCKVAAVGLEPYVHLGKPIRHLQPYFHKLHSKYSFHICGEGGEYETLVLDCPVYRKRLQITESSVYLCGDDQSVGILSITAHEIVAKDILPISPRLDTLDFATDRIPQSITADSIVADEAAPLYTSPRILFDCRINSDGLGCTEMISPTPVTTMTDEAVSQQSRQVLQQLQLTVEAVGSSLGDVVLVRLYLRDMHHFDLVNKEYCTWFDQQPPSRCCIAVSLDPGLFVAAEAVLMRNSAQAMVTEGCNVRKVMHIRSISEWAPVCIGPYSQANVLADCVAFVAGQIGLDPAQMTLVSKQDTEWFEALNSELRQSVDNTSAILEALDSSISSIVSCVVYVNLARVPTETQSSSGLYTALQQAVRQLLSTTTSDEDEDEDTVSSGSDDESTSDRGVNNKKYADAPMLIIPVNGLPRDALVEVEVIAATRKQKNVPYMHAQTTVSMAQLATATSDDVIEPQVKNLPIWQFGVVHHKSRSDVLWAELQVKWTPLALCSMILTLRARDASSHSAISLADIASLVSLGVQQTLDTTNVPVDDVLFVQCYYAAESIPLGALSQQLARSLPSLPAIAYIPLPSMAPNSLLCVRMFAMNTAQLETEIWTRQRA